MIAAVTKPIWEIRAEQHEQQMATDDRDAVSIDPAQPCTAPPGSNTKVLTMMRRYSQGLHIFQADDCDSHGPERLEVPIGSLPRVTRPVDLQVTHIGFDVGPVDDYDDF